MPEENISVDEAAEESGYGRATIFRWIRGGLLEPVKVRGDKRTMLRRADFLRVLAEHGGRPRPRQASAADE